MILINFAWAKMNVYDLSASDAHVPLDRGPRCADREVMALGLAGKQQIESLVDRFPAAITNEFAELDLLVVAQATINCS